MTDIRVQREPFDSGAELNRFLKRNATSGGVASFVGQMRDFRGTDRAHGQALAAMTLEHYPGMAERQLADVLAEAARRWSIDDVCVIHRYGEFAPGDPIVLVITAAAHRGPAFDACAFIMDWLKTKAPFWKREQTPDGKTAWVEAMESDDARAERWGQ
ncbi:MAG: molybdenum cofactor biosynthesis protein MoaE [Rhodospirillaceae bacterium]|nr:MAG: molybdenum cofactor biosynthesis protein MoaE [Rhodospirillaceae bacterium]